MNQDGKKQLGNHRHKATLSFWQVVGFVFLPIVIGYQVLWSRYFANAPQEFWTNGMYHNALLVKLSSELLMYLFMLWYLMFKTSSKYTISKPIVNSIFLIIILYTSYGLLIELYSI